MFKTEKVKGIKLFIFHNGELLLKEFPMGLSNNTNYYKLAFLLCKLDNNEFDDYKPYPENHFIIANSNTVAGFSLYGILAGLILSTFLGVVLTLLYVYKNCHCNDILKRTKMTPITNGAQKSPLLQETTQ